MSDPNSIDTSLLPEVPANALCSIPAHAMKIGTPCPEGSVNE